MLNTRIAIYCQSIWDLSTFNIRYFHWSAICMGDFHISQGKNVTSYLYMYSNMAFVYFYNNAYNKVHVILTQLAVQIGIK